MQAQTPVGKGTELALCLGMVKPPRFQVSILPAERIIPFELPETASAETVPDSETTVVRNPLLVTPMDGGSYLLLDEADRFARLLAAGISQIPAQICRRSQLQVAMESIALFGIEPEHIEQIVDHADNVIIGLAQDEPVPEGYRPVVIDFQTGQQMALATADGGALGCPEGLLRLLQEIDSVGRYARHLSDWYMVDPLVRCARADAVLFPPRLGLDDISQAAITGRLLPPDLVRVSADDRMLAIDFPMSVLRSEMPIEQKTAFLHDLISLRRQARRTSVVQGRVYILNL